MGALFVLPLCLHAQNQKKQPPPHKNDTIHLVDEDSSLSGTVDTSINVDKHHPRLALISSAIIPGLGQVYNRKYWKVPIIYGVGAGLYYGFDFNHSKYLRYQKAYTQLYNEKEVTDEELADLKLSSLEDGRDYYRRNRDYVIIFMGLLYVANVVDAMVDAYLFNYDVSRDLAIRLEPTILPPLPNTYTATCGLSLKINF